MIKFTAQLIFKGLGAFFDANWVDFIIGKPWRRAKWRLKPYKIRLHRYRVKGEQPEIEGDNNAAMWEIVSSPTLKENSPRQRHGFEMFYELLLNSFYFLDS